MQLEISCCSLRLVYYWKCYFPMTTPPSVCLSVGWWVVIVSLFYTILAPVRARNKDILLARKSFWQLTNRTYQASSCHINEHLSFRVPSIPPSISCWFNSSSDSYRFRPLFDILCYDCLYMFGLLQQVVHEFPLVLFLCIQDFIFMVRT